MKDQLESPRDFATSADLWWRAAFLLSVIALAGGVALTIGGIVVLNPKWSAAGLAVVGVAFAGRMWSNRHGEERELATVAAVTENVPPADDGHATILLRLLEQWEAMEAKRGTPDFDAWELQVLRNDIRRVIESDPALEDLFEQLQQAA